jgi:hypothetical protein
LKKATASSRDLSERATGNFSPTIFSISASIFGRSSGVKGRS